MGKWINGYLDKLAEVRRANLAGGRQDGVERMHRLGKLTARERIEQRVDLGPGDAEQRPQPVGAQRVDDRLPTATRSSYI